MTGAGSVRALFDACAGDDGRLDEKGLGLVVAECGCPADKCEQVSARILSRALELIPDSSGRFRLHQAAQVKSAMLPPALRSLVHLGSPRPGTAFV